jgi:glyoxylase-like metal-dependent hydrolase (beta-lactamase superfamily II)
VRAVSNLAYRKGLHEVGDGLFAYLQPDGSWGWSNAGLIVDGDSSLLVDTLFDLRLTREMLRAMERVSPAARAIDTVVNTHANGDHCWGNQLVRGAEIVSSRRSAEEMVELSPGLVATLVRVARLTQRLGRVGAGAGKLAGRVGLRKLAAVTEGADFVVDIFGAFDFRGIDLAPPTRTFSGQLSLDVGNTRVELIEVGPAHTRGDVIAYVPRARTVFTGDILFVGGHPIVWEGPVGNWVAACDRICGMEVDVVVPGHGPLVDLAAVRELRDYLTWLSDAARARHERGMTALDAALDIAGDLGPYRDLGEIERLVVNVDAIYRELDPARPQRDAVELFAEMARFRRLRS